MEVEKHNEDSSSDPDQANPVPAPKKRREKAKRCQIEQTAEGSEEDQQQLEAMKAAHRQNDAADFGHAGEWPVDKKNDSAGAPVRKEPEMGVKGEKKESKKRPKEKKEKDKEKREQPSSSDNNNKGSETVTEGECTTKRNLHMIKTERIDRRKVDEDRDDNEKGDERRKRKKEKRRKESKKEEDRRVKRRSSGERKGEGRQEKKRKKEKTRREVELESIHLSKQKEREKRAPKVERVALKPEGWRDVEREPLYNIIPQYDNLPEDPAMKALKQKPKSLAFTSRSDPPYANVCGAAIMDQTEKKAATEREKKEQLQCSTGPEWSELTEKPSRTADFKKSLQRYSINLFIFLVMMCILCISLCVVIIVLQFHISGQDEELRRMKEANPTRPSPVN